MSKKYLVASGCSWTDHFFTSDYHRDLDTSWDKWPTIVANKLNMEVINLGRCGSGNEGIYSRVLDFVSETSIEKIGIILVAWSGYERRDYEIENSGMMNKRRPYEDGPEFQHFSKHWSNHSYDTEGDLYYHMRRSIRYCYSLQVLCERYNIPYKQFQTIRGGSFGRKESEAIRHLVQSSQYNEINENNFIGWPAFPEMGGFRLCDIIPEKHYRISEEDNHPNKIGQEKIAEFIYENL